MRSVIAGYVDHESGRDALVLSMALARPRGDAVVAAHVSQATHGLDSADRRRARETRQRMGELRQAVTAALAEDAGDWPVGVRDFPAPSAPRGLHDLALSERARLIALGSTHHGPLGRVAVGTTSARLLIKAPCPVAVAPRGFGGREGAPLRSLAVAVDGCPACEKALREAMSLTAALAGCLTALTVVPHRGPAGLLSEGSRTKVVERVDSMLERSGATGVEHRVLEGDPASQLARATPDLDLLIMGCREKGGLLGHPTVGSVSRDLMHSAASPVLVVPEGAPVEDAPAPRAETGSGSAPA